MIILDPIFKLELLKEYMNWRIDGGRESVTTFPRWIKSYRKKYVYPHPESLRYIATHCFYCGKKEKNGNPLTVDHFYPKFIRDSPDGVNRIRVICCGVCNVYKSCKHPADFSRSLTVHAMNGWAYRKYSKEATKLASSRVAKIMDDITSGNYKLVYYTRKGNHLPKPFIEI